MTIAAAVAAVVVALCAGVGVTSIVWPRREPLPWLAWFGLAGVLGPCAVGFGLLLCGALGVPSVVSLPLLAAASVLAGIDAFRRRAARGQAAPLGHRALMVLVLVASTWTGALALRTHLGWDGTVGWYGKARIIAAGNGALPTAALADATRTWMAPDYPLHVPLAMAWVRLWLPVEDERAIKLLPATWAAALFCLVAAAVLERSRVGAGADRRAACAVVVLASAPRVLVGEGGLTSGYADGPVAALLAATVWTAWRANWGGDGRFLPLLGTLAAALAWTKQEGAVAVAIVAVACMWRHRRLRTGSFALPAAALVATWQVWTIWQGAPTGMAYAWPGMREAAARLGPIARAYLTEVPDVRTWGLLWVGLGAAMAVTWTRAHRIPLAILAGIVLAGAGAFTLSDWPDLEAHLEVTVPRQLMQIVALATILAFCEGETTRDRG